MTDLVGRFCDLHTAEAPFRGWDILEDQFWYAESQTQHV
jgi:hypothetical protein